jgi:beta-phosphoglucomutase-like phosphatase (HAD superfamily)
MTYSAILFDLDGTLVDTIPLWQQAYLTTLQEEGITMDL